LITVCNKHKCYTSFNIMTRRYSSFLPAIIYVIDLILLNISIALSHLLLFGFNKLANSELMFILLANFSWSTVSVISKSFHLSRPLSLKTNLNKFITTLIYHLLFVLAVIQILSIALISKYEVAITYFLFWVAVIIVRSVVFFVLDIYRKKGYNNRRVVVIGDREICNRLMENIADHPEYGYNVVRTIYDNELKTFSDEQLLNRLFSYDINEIYVCYKQLDHEFLNKLITFADTYFIKIKLISDLLIYCKHTQLITYDGIPAIMVTSNDLSDQKIIFLKRAFDIIFSCVVMLLGLPVFIMLYCITKLTSKGKAFYKQERIGLNGKPFYIYKFRSMHSDSESAGPQLASQNDKRITKWGKIMRQTRLDELPQFWNVLKGDMSVVGPRPERQYFIEKILERPPHYRRLLNIRPGIT